MRAIRLIRLVWLVVSALLFSPMAHLKDTDVRVSTLYGDILGEKIDFPQESSLLNGPMKSVNRFLGVPFAQPPIGHLRFQPPSIPSSWKPKTYNATNFRSACIQDQEYINFFGKNLRLNFSEDCLYLNVYSPADKPTNTTLFPVMVYIHGGGYEAGSPSVSPGDVLPLWGVVLVTIQYRLGLIGFFTTGDSTAPGNNGMLDQIHALKWVKDNIRNFGGDPNKVTIFGESAGGSSVGLQVLSPLSEGLFHRAIAISGVDLSPFAITTKAKAVQLSKQHAAKLHCAHTDNKKMLTCLSKVDAKKLIIGYPNSWRPFVDGVFLTDTPRNLRKDGKFHRIPLMAGFTSDEGAYFMPPFLNYMKLDRSSFSAFADLVFRNIRSFGLDSEKQTETIVAMAVQSQYLPWPDTRNKEELRQKIVDIMTDYSFAAPTDTVLEEHSKLAPVFMYEYGYRSKLSPHPSWMGVTHKDDTPFQFGFPLMDLRTLQSYDKADQNMSRFIITLFTNFAKFGNPTPDELQEITWSPFDQSNRAYLYINHPSEMRTRFRPCNMAFWNRYYPSILSSVEHNERRSRNGGDKLPLQVFWAMLCYLFFVLFAILYIRR